MKKFSLATQIMIALFLGIVTGIFFIDNPDFALEYIQPVGTLFLNLIKMIVVPIVLFSIMSGVVSLSDIRQVGSIGVKTIVFYLSTTAVAIALGLFVANLVGLGTGEPILSEIPEYTVAEAPSFIETLVNIFPSNIVAPMSSANMLQIIVIALFFGFGVILAGEKGKPFEDFVNSGAEVSMKVMSMIIKFSPYGVFALIVPVVAVNGPEVLGSLFFLIVVVYISYILHAVIVYSSVVKIVLKMSPITFFKGVAPAVMMAFSSASSVSALPLNIECCEKLGAKKEITSFVLPLGATINMDGTAIYQGCCVMFIASVYGIDLTFAQQLTIILTATLASIGTAGVPGSGMIMLAMVLQSVGLPVEGIALIAGIDRILDMGRTAVNINGDAACALMISALEDKQKTA